MKICRVWRICGVCLALLACTKPGHFRSEDSGDLISTKTVKMEELPADFKIPANIWELVTKSDDEKPGTEANSLGVFYSSVKLFLTEKNPHILQTPSYVIEFPQGGGMVDLAQYLSGQQGSFYVGFELPPEFQEGSNFKAIYISKARKRKLDERIFGAGCNKYFDITPKFLEMMKTEGIKANTTRQRHVTLLAGHYIFSVIKDHRLHITQVTITDSQNKNLLCEAL
ncbi:MAG: hypothetical protein ACXWRE_07255 [Pseudobdellovibrionaceae bacterium]